MKKLQITLSLLSALALPLATGCMLDGDDPEEIATALELDNGGLEMTDELPAFGDAELFTGVAEDEVYVDTMASDPTVVELNEAPDAVLFHTVVRWGQIPGDPDNETIYDWSGFLRVNRGAIVVRRVLAFEPGTDSLLPRDDRAVVPFISYTRPHNDGLIVTIIDPTPEADEPLVLAYANPDGVVFSATMRSLVDGPQSLAVDADGNRVVAVAFPRAIDLCEYGFLAGKWHRVAEGRGRMIGRVANAVGDPLGHIKGIYGRRLNGNQVFFGKYINLDGNFMGIFKGTYADGHFIGRWLHRSGERGALGGEYRETIPGPEVGGHFLGRWAETSCNLLAAE